MQRMLSQGTVVLVAGAALAMLQCSNNDKKQAPGSADGTGGSGASSNDGGSSSSPTSTSSNTSGSGAAAGMGGEGGEPATGGTGGTGTGGSSGMGGTGAGGSSTSSTGGSGTSDTSTGGSGTSDTSAGGAAGAGGSDEPSPTTLEEAEAEALSVCGPPEDFWLNNYLTNDDDVLFTNVESSELVHGMDGADVIGLEQKPTVCVLGGRGDDVVTIGYAVRGTVNGGSGADVFRFTGSQVNTHIEFPDFVSGVDKILFDSATIPLDANQPFMSIPEFDGTTPVNTPATAYTVVVSFSSFPLDPAAIWLTNNDGTTQVNMLIGSIYNYSTYARADFGEY